MGMLMSFMGGKGDIPNRIFVYATDSVYDKLVEKEPKNFEEFHVAILDIYNTINMALPGRHYDAPSREKVLGLFNQLTEVANTETLKMKITEFMKDNLTHSKVDSSMVITGIVAPPAAMVVKRTGQGVPQLSLMKSIPDVVFVPSATLLALLGVKVSSKIFSEKAAS